MEPYAQPVYDAAVRQVYAVSHIDTVIDGYDETPNDLVVFNKVFIYQSDSGLRIAQLSHLRLPVPPVE